MTNLYVCFSKIAGLVWRSLGGGKPTLITAHPLPMKMFAKKKILSLVFKWRVFVYGYNLVDITNQLMAIQTTFK